MANPPENFKILDASWHYSDEKNNGKELYASFHLVGAQHFDIGEIAIKDSGLCATFPTNEIFSTHMARMGIRPDDKIVIYDQIMPFSST